MARPGGNDPPTGHWLRLIARVLSAVVIAGFLLAYTRFGAPGGDDYPVLETAALIAFGIVSLSMLLAWRWEGAFGMAVVVGGVFIRSGVEGQDRIGADQG